VSIDDLAESKSEEFALRRKGHLEIEAAEGLRNNLGPVSVSTLL
jgi:hypothetical protein